MCAKDSLSPLLLVSQDDRDITVTNVNPGRGVYGYERSAASLTKP